MQQWAKERGVDWNSLYDPTFPIGTVTATNSFDLGDEVMKISQQDGDYIRITHTNSTFSDYQIPTADRLLQYSTGNFVSKIGRTIRFNKAFTATSPQFGGSITAPVYLFPTTFSAAADEVLCDDPNWLVFVVAADRVKNDVTRKDLRADLVSQANEAMLGMKEDNEAQLSTTYRPWNPTSHVTNEGAFA